MFRELVRLDTGISGFRKKPDESDAEYRARVQDFGRLYASYGLQLISSSQYQRADDEIQRGALDYLNSRAKHLLEHGRQAYAAGPLSPAALIDAAIESQQRKTAGRKAARR